MQFITGQSLQSVLNDVRRLLQSAQILMLRRRQRRQRRRLSTCTDQIRQH